LLGYLSFPLNLLTAPNTTVYHELTVVHIDTVVNYLTVCFPWRKRKKKFVLYFGLNRCSFKLFKIGGVVLVNLYEFLQVV